MSCSNDFLGQFAKHTPRILRRQLLLQLAEQYLCGDRVDESNYDAVCKPSIQRFYGALLFIDISGFTVLSQRLNVEELKNHINEYFTKMLDIVDKHDGDVVKFAGDALFIIWESHSINGNESIEELNKIAVEKATECGKEVTEACCNHKIVLSHAKPVRRISYDSDNNQSPLLGGLQTNSPSNSNYSATPPEEDCAFLNIHSGVSVGLMAGVDIGADNRWEYFLIGEPLSKVAEAEGQASQGDLIMCPESHSMIHPPEPIAVIANTRRSISNIVTSFRQKFRRESFRNSIQASSNLPCGCFMLKNGYCKLKINATNPEKRKAVRRHRNSHTEMKVVDGLKSDLNDVVKSFGVAFKNEYSKHVHSYRLMKPGGLRHGHHEMTEETMLNSFKQWAESCILDDVVRHVHHVVRNEFTFSDISRNGAYQKDFELHWNASSQLKVLERAESPVVLLPSVTHKSFNAGNSSPNESPLLKSRSYSPASMKLDLDAALQASATPSNERLSLDSFSDSETKTASLSDGSSVPTPHRAAPRKQNSLLRSSLTSPHTTTSSISAEIRSVTVMFIKISMTEVDLLIDSTNREKIGGSYRFLGTTLNEKVADQRLLNRFQRSIEALSSALTSQGGQMRQFIVDDKGTVCIGTFGLRGSVNDDNAAAALEAAHAIVIKLQNLGLACSIGVTVGRTFCGLVGSSNRHEYAVMGPSTNLSARLMCKAPMYGVICDGETRQRDRTHGFISLGDIVAKGYSSPVGTYKPVFPEVEAMLNVPEYSITMRSKTDESSSSYSFHKSNKIIMRMIDDHAHVSHCRLQGRSEEVSRAIMFGFSSLVEEVYVAIKASSKDEKVASIFDVKQSARYIGILATDGMGKSHLASAIAGRVYTVCKHTPGCNIQMFKSRFDSYNQDVPFNAWKPIIIEMISRIYRSRKISSPCNSTKANSEIMESVYYLMSQLPTDMQYLLPLFGYLTLLPGQNEALKALNFSSQETIDFCVQLLLKVVEVYTNTLQNLVFITMEDVHAFDKASLRLMHEIHFNSTGVVILFTARTTKLIGAHTDRLDPGSVLHEFMSPLKKSSRVLELELQGLTKEATTELVKSALKHMGAYEEDNSFYDKVYEVSGGNPLYAFEIAKSYAVHHEVAGKTSVGHNVRTEEVICYRFDQLKNSAQTLLKMAAVICSNDNTFSLDLLSRIDDWDLLQGNDSFTYPILSEIEEEYWSSNDLFNMEEVYSTTRVKYAKILYGILRYESFLRVVSTGSHKNEDLIDGNIELLLTCNCSFEFVIPLEQTTIYNLLLDDQKQALHEGIAEYYSRCRTQDLSTKGKVSYTEEGYHWYKASVWSKAMACNYRAYESETDYVKRSEHLDVAYMALQGMASAGETNHLGISFTNLQAMFEDSMETNQKGLQIDPTEGAVITLERTYEIFNGDSNLLHIGLYILGMVSRQRKHRFENSSTTQLILEDAIQMMLLTKNPFLMNSKYIEILQNSRSEARVDGEELDLGEMHFCLYKFWPCCFRILSAYLMNYVMSNSVSSDYSRKVIYVAGKFLELARIEGHSVDVIQALCMNALIQNKLSNMKQSLQFVCELEAMQLNKEYAQQLIETYGCDHLLYLMIRTVKYLILSNNMTAAIEKISIVIDWFHSLTHVASLTLACLRLVSVLAFISRFSDALVVLDRYDNIVSKQHLHPSEHIPEKIIRLYREWLNRHLAFQNKSEVSVDSIEADKLINNIEILVSSKDKHTLENNSLLMYHKLEVMIVLGDIYALKVNKDISNEVELTNDCLVCCMYLQNIINTRIIDTHDLFSKARVVRIALQILRTLADLNNNSEYHKKFRKIFAITTIAELKTESSINQLHSLYTEVEELKVLLYGTE